jgi:hypothetical protein
MTIRSRLIVALAVAGILGTAAATSATKTPVPTGTEASAQTAVPSADAPEPMSAPVLHITSVEIIRSAHAPVLDILRVRGLASTAGWEEAELVPLSRGVPTDGILELVLVARAPVEVADAKGFEEVEAIFPLEPGHPFKGVNVHSATDSVAVAQLPGYAENKFASDDCSQCVGKTFVARGARTPAGVSEAESIHEEHLPAGTRVVKHTDGIPTAGSDPNRLTVLVGNDGKVTAAVWD